MEPIEEVVKRYRNTEGFQMLVQTHLSFVLDLSTVLEKSPSELDEGLFKKWNVFHLGTPSTSTEATKELTMDKIASVEQIIAFLGLEKNITQEGIFRKTGAVTRQKNLKTILNQGTPFSLEQGAYTANDCACALKTFIADLEEPLLTELYYPAYCQLADLMKGKDFSDYRILCGLQLLMLLLPEANSALFRSLIELLNRVAQYQGENKMSADNLAIIFTPHLLCPRKHGGANMHSTSQKLFGIVARMIDIGTNLFDIPNMLATDIRANFMRESGPSDCATSTNTVYTFVDREKTAKVDTRDFTDQSLAALHSHVQALPDSAMKKKFLKDFQRVHGKKE
ncbi:rho gtpase activating protein [Anopheles sinensis]|uniref:Rho gtpase activating protein n=1 Tax=Anopheles sinensis TaxID=74873 RepID=A0A084VFN7_ANOSI|nr:rho gtpase activating protein [Anopheles sinensis]